MIRKNIIKVPDSIREKLKGLPDEIIVGCSKKIAHHDICEGKWSHLGITLDAGHVTGPSEILPERDRGRFSRRNLDGHEVVRKDLPKVWKYYTFEVPNFGDWLRGSHDITIGRQVYPRELKGAHEATITVDVVQQGSESAIVKFTVNVVLKQSSADFDYRLLAALNLMQENVGGIGVFHSQAPLSEYLKTIHLDWEILPVGARDVVLNRLLSGNRVTTEVVRGTIEARRKLLEEFHPTGWVVGSSGLRRYFGAKFRDELVVFENIQYGNAVYVLCGPWEELSKLSRLELMEREEGIVRIVHRDGWEARLRKVLQDKLRPLDTRKAA